MRYKGVLILKDIDGYYRVNVEGISVIKKFKTLKTAKKAIDKALAKRNPSIKLGKWTPAKAVRVLKGGIVQILK